MCGVMVFWKWKYNHGIEMKKKTTIHYALYHSLAELSHFITIYETRRGYGYMDCMLGNRKLNLHRSITII